MRRCTHDISSILANIPLVDLFFNYNIWSSSEIQIQFYDYNITNVSGRPCMFTLVYSEYNTKEDFKK